MKMIKMNLNYTIKSEIIVITLQNLEELSQYLQFKIKIIKGKPIVFYKGSTYDYHFIINKLAKEFDDQLESLGVNTEKYITFSVPLVKNSIMVKQLRID